MNDNLVFVKKRRLCEDGETNRTNYEDFSKEQLIRRIEELESRLKESRKSSINVPNEESCPSEDTRNRKSRRTGKEGRPFDFSRCSFRTVAFKLLYLGWDYDGFVTQDNTTNTIENHLFNALRKTCLIESREKSNYHRCGRTDQGVSSFSQVISVTVRSRLNAAAEGSPDQKELPYCKMLNALLPKNIRIVAWASVSKEFSARFSCRTRTYKYWFPRSDLNIESMKEALRSIVGYNDFRNLCKMDVGNGVTNFKRRICEANLVLCSSSEKTLFHNDHLDESYTMAELTIVGEGFLWHQIRAIVSVLFLIGQNKEESTIFAKLLDVESCPKKPQYSISSALPLNLYDCEFEKIDWQVDAESLKEVIRSLQSQWTCVAVKCRMLESMLRKLQNTLHNETMPKDLYAVLFKDLNSRIYKPLLTRPTADSLEDRISHYTKKGKFHTITSDGSGQSEIKERRLFAK